LNHGGQIVFSNPLILYNVNYVIKFGKTLLGTACGPACIFYVVTWTWKSSSVEIMVIYNS